jgi:hypothetical protein
MSLFAKPVSTFARHALAAMRAANWPTAPARTILLRDATPGVRPVKQGGRHMAKRTTHRSSKGTKLYAVRDKKGKFKDIQSYKRAHGADIKRKAKVEK